MSGSLSSAQFRDVAYEHRVGNQTFYQVASQPVEQEATGDLQGISVGLQHPKTEFDYSHDDRYPFQSQQDTRTESHRYGPEDVYGSDGRLLGRQGTLFGYEHERPVVNWMNANQGYQHYAASLLGVAAQESMSRFGEYPVSDADLSDHSSRMVGRLARAGAVQYPEEEHRNDMDFPDYPAAYLPKPEYSRRLSKIQPWRLAAGRRLIGQVLRGSGPSPAARKPPRSDKGKAEPEPKGQQALFGT